jgi:hypothetical protein
MELYILSTAVNDEVFICCIDVKVLRVELSQQSKQHLDFKVSDAEEWKRSRSKIYMYLFIFINHFSILISIKNLRNQENDWVNTIDISRVY